MKLVKTFAILCLGALLVGCGAPDSGSNESGLWLSLDKADIYNNNGATEDGIAHFTLKYNGAVLSPNDYELYTTDWDEVYGGIYTSENKGTVTFFAQYGTLQSNHVSLTVVATPPAAPAAPVDNNPSNLNFNRRVLLAQFTGTACSNCPHMINALYEIVNDEAYKDMNYDSKIAIAAAHIGYYAVNSKGAMEKELTFEDAYNVPYYPYIIADLKRNVGDVKSNAPFVANMVNTALSRVAVKGGIAVNSKYHAEEEYIVLTAAVKAKESTEFRIGAMLLEDDIQMPQSIAGDVQKNPNINYNMHENCIRRIRGKQTDHDFSGFTLGYIASGESTTKDFAFPLLKTWNPEKLRLLVYISTKEADGKWYVNNVVKASIDGETDFEYAE